MLKGLLSGLIIIIVSIFPGCQTTTIEWQKMGTVEENRWSAIVNDVSVTFYFQGNTIIYHGDGIRSANRTFNISGTFYKNQVSGLWVVGNELPDEKFCEIILQSVQRLNDPTIEAGKLLLTEYLRKKSGGPIRG